MTTPTATTATTPADGTPGALFHAGRLADAAAAAQAALRRAPTDLGARLLLAELLAFQGNTERADVLLDAASDLDPGAAVAVAEFRQLLRADVARRQLFRDGRVPEFLGEPTECQRHALAALVALRAGDGAEAQRLALAAEAARVPAPGRHGGAAFADLRDADDLLAGTFEVLTTTGKYYWIPTERVASAEFHAPRRPRDLLWRRVSMSVADGPDGDVYLPATYAVPGADPPPDDQLLLGRATDWRAPAADGATAPVRGLGLRVFLLGEEAATIMELGRLEFGAGV